MGKILDASLDPATIVSRDPELHGGELVFAGTRVPVDTFLDYLKGGHTVDEFLEGYPTVSRRQAEGLLDLAIAGALDALRTPGRPTEAGTPRSS